MAITAKDICNGITWIGRIAIVVILTLGLHYAGIYREDMHIIEQKREKMQDDISKVKERVSSIESKVDMINSRMAGNSYSEPYASGETK
jgi:hypothetical protein